MEDVFPAEDTEAEPRNLPLFKSSMWCEERRLRTFQHWPDSSPVSAPDLAKAGFFFLGPGDRVQCFCCGGILRRWEAGDVPMLEHLKFFPSCRFACGKEAGNEQGFSLQEQEMLPIRDILDCVDGQIFSLLQRMDTEETALPSHPEYPEMRMEEMRLATFHNWPPYNEMYPEQLAHAGFFYTGHGDTVKCFYCDGTMRDWMLGDDPWREHAKWFPRCEFLLQSKGRAFVTRVQETYFNPQEPLGDSWSRDEQEPSAIQDPMGNRELPSPLDQSCVVQNVLQMGFDHSLVISLAQSKYLLTGTCYLSESELVSDLLQTTGEESTSAEGNRVHVDPAPRDSGTSGLKGEAQAECSKESAGPTLSTEEQLRCLQEERMCKVCMDKDVSVVFVPCGHLVACAECAPNLRRCPICRASIQGSVRTFLS
ncbi:PREDICTED: baculoviral IAP repeat-containing protein 7 isoform X1 [Gavialis gangeticus]|uniref:baculoviral IAP repeat-containing protein 7 isoform X1 n=1 Tax=Gavialis gangeticus TaxID=94835 RepID=UPI00092F1446|nr:PREDICTED: baculoviral IAP repeat-containing protein 7 isoform X1 [Gavialis gangeticus]XP_019365663.1 PREDICTED: baculoviral IAP repeat-containing protein 7 isoform X1 [Gavialis gangeticus]XP_019365664.1 PREDICTED: baculoviral IAP repeat-containing protein 7 isoform X1 [Gavialis gangeticus]